jgi:predicted mannosyl-3-phosphoglycerate phosphatase (HAD superfamily)
MKQAISVISKSLMDGRLKFETSEAQAADILDRLNAAGFQIMEPSDKVFNSTDPLRDKFAGQAMAAILQNTALIPGARNAQGIPELETTAAVAYLHADAMMKEREKRQ